MFFEFSGPFNAIQPALLRGKLEASGVDQRLAPLTDQCVRPVCLMRS